MKYRLKTKADFQMADDTLRNVFASCNIKIQTESVQKLYQKQQREMRTFRMLMILSVVCLVSLLLLPILFPTSHVRISEDPQSDASISVVQHHLENDIFYITMSGDEIDYEHIEIIDPAGNSVPMISVDPKSKTLVFPFEGDELNIIIPDKDGKELHLLLSPKEKGR